MNILETKMELTLCNDGFIRDRDGGLKVGQLCKTKDGFYFKAIDDGFPFFDHEIDYFWSQFDNNREAFEEKEKPRIDRDPLQIIEDIEMGYEISYEDRRTMEQEYGPDWTKMF